MIKIGEQIRYFRKQAGLTQKELAQKAGIALITLQQYELGKRQPRIDQIYKIAVALDVNIIKLIDIPQPDLDSTGEEEMKALHGFFYPLESERRKKEKLNAAFDQLNNEGQGVAVQRVAELTEIPRYRKDAPDDQTPQGEG